MKNATFGCFYAFFFVNNIIHVFAFVGFTVPNEKELRLVPFLVEHSSLTQFPIVSLVGYILITVQKVET